MAVLRLVEHISNDATMQREKVILSFPTYLMYSAWVKNHYADIMRTNSSLTSTQATLSPKITKEQGSHRKLKKSSNCFDETKFVNIFQTLIYIL